MRITREQLEAGAVDFSGIDTGRRMRPVHPGRILRREFLDPMGITPYRLAKDLNVPLTRIAAILAARRAITAETALRLSRYFGMSSGFWLGLQARYELETAMLGLAGRLKVEVKPRKVA